MSAALLVVQQRPGSGCCVVSNMIPRMLLLRLTPQGSSSIYATPRRSADISSLLRPSNSRLPSYAGAHSSGGGAAPRGAGARGYASSAGTAAAAATVSPGPASATAAASPLQAASPVPSEAEVARTAASEGESLLL